MLSEEPMTRFEPVTSSLPRKCSAAELHRRGAGNGTRTRNVQLGRLSLYQLSYPRMKVVRIKKRPRYFSSFLFDAP